MRRSLLPCLLAALCALGACAPRSSQPKNAERERFLEMFARAYVPGRSGQFFLVPREGSFFLSRKALDFYHYMHGSPWDYDTRIPILFYGKGHVRAVVDSGPARLQDIAPTILAMMKMAPADSMTGEVLSEAIADAPAPPKVAVVIVLDAMGRATWEANLESIPTLDGLRRQGAWFENARLDYLPSVTSVGHATVSTGTDPRFHGIQANSAFIGGKPVGPFENNDPHSLRVRSLSDYWTQRTSGQGVVVVQGSTTRAAVPLAGHGRAMDARSQVLLTTLDERTAKWTTNTAYFLELPDTSSLLRTAGLGDGHAAWMGHRVDSGPALLRTGMFPRLQMNALLKMLRDKRIGHHGGPDLVLLNFKTPDFVSHDYGPRSSEMRGALDSLDTQLASLVKYLDDSVGAQNYVMAITADHGMPPDTTEQSRRIYVQDLASAVDAQLGSRVLGDSTCSYFDDGSAQICIDDSVLATKKKALRDIDGPLRKASPYILYVFTEDEVAAAAGRLEKGRHR